MNVNVTVGVGMWKVSKRVNLASCPHTNDFIDVDGITLQCDRVYIGSDYVQIESIERFQSESDMDEYIQAGWTK